MENREIINQKLREITNMAECDKQTKAIIFALLGARNMNMEALLALSILPCVREVLMPMAKIGKENQEARNN